MLNSSAFEDEHSGNPDIFYHKSFDLSKDASGGYADSSITVGQQVLQVIQENFPRAQGLKVTDKGEVFARILHMGTLFTVQAFPARASIHRNNSASCYTLTLESKIPKLEAAVSKYKAIELYFTIGGGLLIAILLAVLLNMPAPDGSGTSIKVSSLVFTVGIGGSVGAFLGRVVGNFWLTNTLKKSVSNSAFATKARLEQQLSTKLDAVVDGSRA